MSSNSNAQHRKGFRQLMKIVAMTVFAFVFAIILAGYCVWAYVQERHDLPPFDQEKAKALSPEKRAEYDRLLFNQLPDRSQRILEEQESPGRETKLKQMAADGHELSYWFLRAWSEGRWQLNIEPSLAYFDGLAAQGDANAMCLYYWLSIGTGQQELQNNAQPYLENAAKLGQPECQRFLGREKRGLIRKTQHNDREPTLAEEQEIYDLFAASASKGSRASFNLYELFFYRNVSKPANAERAYYWASVYTRQFLPTSPDMYKFDKSIMRTIRRFKTPDLDELANRLEGTRPTVQQCIDLGLQ